MKKLVKDYILFFVSITSFLLFSLSFLLMGLSDSAATGIKSMIPGIMFWLFLIAGIVIQIILIVRRKKRIIRERTYSIEKPKNVGIVSFFQNYPALIADCVFFICLISLVFVFIYNPNGLIGYVILSIGAFSFCMHCIFNGRVYNHIVNHKKILFARDKKREKPIEKGVKEDVKGEE